MSQSLPKNESPFANGNAFSYVLPCYVEELLKIGFSTNPIRRFQAFHSRYYEVFDLERGFLIETDRVSEAREVERALMRDIAAHNAPAPTTIRPGAAGDTEWYRGVYAHAVEMGNALASRCGYVIRAPLRSWLQQQLANQASMLYEWSANAFAAIAAEGLDLRDDDVALGLSRMVVDKVDAYGAMGLGVRAFVTTQFYDWYQSHSQIAHEIELATSG
jgi:hypothetical protein